MNEFLYYLVLSFAGSMILIFLSKVVMNKPIRRNKNYYEAEEKEVELRMLRDSNLKKTKTRRRQGNGGVR